MILSQWQLSGEHLPERLQPDAPETSAFTLPGAQALAQFLGNAEESEPSPREPRAPFTLPALLPQDMPGPAVLSRQIDLRALTGDRATLRFSLLCGRGEVFVCDSANDAPRRVAAFRDGPLALDLSPALAAQKCLRVELRFDASRPAGVCGAVVLHTASAAVFESVTVQPLAGGLLDLRADVKALQGGEYVLTAQPCPPRAPLPEAAPPARAIPLYLTQDEARRVHLTLSAPAAAFVPGQPYDAPAVRLTLQPRTASGCTRPPCDTAIRLYGQSSAPAETYLPLTNAECRLPPPLLLERLHGAHISAIELPVPASDALYVACSRAGVAVRQMAQPAARERLARFPCVAFVETARREAVPAALRAWRLCGVTPYARGNCPDLPVAELLTQATGRPIAEARAAEVLPWLRAVSIRLTAEAVRQGRMTGPLCAPGEWTQSDVLEALQTALAPTHLSALPLCGAWWTGTHFSASLRALGAPQGARAEVVLEDAQGEVLARVCRSCPEGESDLGLIEATLPAFACVLELTTRLYAGDALLEECAFPVYVGEHGPLEAAF